MLALGVGGNPTTIERQGGNFMASVHLLPQAELFMIYFIMTAVLMFRPEGLFQRETARRI